MDLYCVLGNPIRQSRSPFIHQQFALQTGQQICYQAKLVAFDRLESAVLAFIQAGGKGANITVPFKEQALQLCDQLSERAKLAGAVNTLSFIDHQIIGDNTDGIGLVNDLKREKVELENAQILVLGAGGAAKGVIAPLLVEKPKSLVIANRNFSKAQAIAQQYNLAHVNAYDYTQIPKIAFDLIINATSASLYGEMPAIKADLIKSNTTCYDMVYQKEPTIFLQWAKEQGASKIIDGLGMLVRQAAESFYIWRGVKPQPDEVLLQLRKELFKA
jgi:shikimate dehydrogenase